MAKYGTYNYILKFWHGANILNSATFYSFSHFMFLEFKSNLNQTIFYERSLKIKGAKEKETKLPKFV